MRSSNSISILLIIIISLTHATFINAQCFDLLYPKDIGFGDERFGTLITLNSDKNVLDKVVCTSFTLNPSYLNSREIVISCDQYNYLVNCNNYDAIIFIFYCDGIVFRISTRLFYKPDKGKYALETFNSLVELNKEQYPHIKEFELFSNNTNEKIGNSVSLFKNSKSDFSNPGECVNISLNSTFDIIVKETGIVYTNDIDNYVIDIDLYDYTNVPIINEWDGRQE